MIQFNGTAVPFYMCVSNTQFQGGQTRLFVKNNGGKPPVFDSQPLFDRFPQKILRAGRQAEGLCQ
jgi:hypothetical protein